MADAPVEPAPAIFGYTSKFSFAPGERVPVHVSCEQIERYTAQLVRLRHGYEGPGQSRLPRDRGSTRPRTASTPAPSMSPTPART